MKIGDLSKSALRAVCLTLALASASVSTVGSANAMDYWIGGVDPVVQKSRHVGDPADYMDLFKPGSPWPVASAHLQAFEISAQMALTGTDEQLKTVMEGLRSRHIGLAVQLGNRNWTYSLHRATSLLSRTIRSGWEPQWITHWLMPFSEAPCSGSR